jgi:YD repeat-containing protein
MPDALGHRTVVTDADGVATTSTYDSLGRLTATCDALDNCTHYDYDALGNRTRMTNAKLRNRAKVTPFS